MFAIITPALIIGSIAERMKFKAILVFMTLWMFIVYFTQGHMVWGVNGMMNGCWNADATIQRPRLRRRHGGAYDLRLVGLGAVHHPRQTPRLRQGKLRAAQHGADLTSALACSGSAGTGSTPAAPSRLT